MAATATSRIGKGSTGGAKKGRREQAEGGRTQERASGSLPLLQVLQGCLGSQPLQLPARAPCVGLYHVERKAWRGWTGAGIHCTLAAALHRGGGGSKRDQHGYPPGQTIRNWKPKPTTENPDKRPRTGRRLMSPPLGGSSSEAGKCGRAAGRHPHGSPRARPRTGPDRWSNCMPEIETAKMPKNSNYAKINFLTQRFPKTALF